ncbi:hypothetical protein FRUB_03286 [Fimbriiglobus ruber]|uniref:Putative restriction endonuclease domain-containing protein n=1 Tax=Fimbriiglobus ruber TaxID=1908690 RepID=A0A225E5I6_9BACT|nr:hypothetical protein FRUB_03286 [Fimbriiglobus ruber]
MGADAAFILARSFPIRESKEGYLETIPEIVVEIRSKNDTQPEIASKVTEYLDAGTLVVWILDPDEQTVTAHRLDQPAQIFRSGDNLTCSDLLPGFATPVVRLFGGV